MRFCLSLCLGLACFAVFAQEQPQRPEVKVESLNSNFLYIIDGKKIDQPQGVTPPGSSININSLVNPMDIESINIIKGEMAIKAFGKVGENGVVYIVTRKSTQPICILDGEKMAGGLSLLSTLDPDKIQSVEVIKGESALTTYGSPGRNGVIIVTTKKFVTAK